MHSKYYGMLCDKTLFFFILMCRVCVSFICFMAPIISRTLLAFWPGYTLIGITQLTLLKDQYFTSCDPIFLMKPQNSSLGELPLFASPWYIYCCHNSGRMTKVGSYLT